MKKNLCILLATIVFPNAFAQQFAVVRQIAVSGSEGWDYLAVNEPAQQLFVSHGSVVQVLDLGTDKIIATIPDTKGVHGIAIATDLGKAFITDGKDNAVTIVDLKTFALIAKVMIQGVKPDAVLYDPFSKRVFVYNAKSNDATVLDAATNAIIRTIPLNGKPEFSVTNNKGLVYVNIEDKNQIKVIDATTLSVINTWSIAPGESPSGLAIDIRNNRLFSVCENELMVVIDAKSGAVLQTLPIGAGCDGVAFDEKRRLAFACNGEGTITVVKESGDGSLGVLQTVKTEKGARTITLNRTTGAVYTPTSNYGAPPSATADNPHPRPSLVPGTFKILVVSQK